MPCFVSCVEILNRFACHLGTVLNGVVSMSAPVMLTEKLMAKVPLAFSIMFFISVMLFNSLRHPLIIFLGLPLALVGVSGGLLIFNQPFGFMSLLGF